MSVEAVDEGLDGRFVDVADVGGSLTRLIASNNGLRLDEPEGVDDNLSFHRLNRVDHDGDRAGVKRLK